MSPKKLGIIISYLNLISGMAVNIFLTPYLIATLGDVDYSIYKVMQSFSGPLSMFHLGISTIVTRCIIKSKNNKEFTEKDKKNTLALALIASCVMSIFLIIASVVMYKLIPSIYGTSYSMETIELGQKIFTMFVGSSVLHMLTDTFSGCLTGHEKHTVSALIPLFKTVFRVVFVIVLLQLGTGALGVVLIDLIVAVAVLIFTLLYAVFKLREIPTLYYFDKKQLGEILTFGAAILLQAFVNQVNNNVDTIILGSLIQEKWIITMYSSALAIYAMYNSLISVCGNFFLPKATELVERSASGKELTDFVIKPGRFQAMVAIACIAGFGLFGRDFITIWIGEKYSDAYFIILMLIVPVTIPLVENVAISILDATLKRLFRSIVLVIMSIINIVLSLLFISFMGFWGAALGTLISLLVGHGILMNIYYAKVFKMQIFRMFKEIFAGILPSGLIAAVVCSPLVLIIKGRALLFSVSCLLYLAVYLLFLYIWGFTCEEKNMLKNVLIKNK